MKDIMLYLRSQGSVDEEAHHCARIAIKSNVWGDYWCADDKYEFERLHNGQDQKYGFSIGRYWAPRIRFDVYIDCTCCFPTRIVESSTDPRSNHKILRVALYLGPSNEVYNSKSVHFVDCS